MTESGDARKMIANRREVWHRHCVDAYVVALLVTIGLILPPCIAEASGFSTRGAEQALVWYPSPKARGER